MSVTTKGLGSEIFVSGHVLKVHTGGCKPNFLNINVMKFSHLRTKPILVIQRLSPYRAVNTLHFGYKTQYVNDVKGKVTVFCETRTKYINAM